MGPPLADYDIAALQECAAWTHQMKRTEFLRRVADMCGPVEVDAVQHLAALPPEQRRRATRRLAEAASDRGLSEFLMSLIDDDLIDELAAILPGGSGHQSAEDLLALLWARLLLMIGPEAKDVVYAHNQLRLMIDERSRNPAARRGSNVDRAYRSALENARAVLATTADVEHPVRGARHLPKGKADE
jgi:hypothetical protein